MNKKNLKFILSVFIVWRLFISLAAYFGSLLITFKEGFPYVLIAKLLSNNILFWPWANFDGVHYLHIADEGYAQFEQAFFPLYPLIIKYTGLVLGNRLFSSLVISNICFLLCLFLLYKLVRLDFSSKVAKWTVVFLVLFPTSFFFGAVYTESLFLMLVLLSFWAARTGRWWLAGVAGVLATATRFVGIMLLPAILVEFVGFEVNFDKGIKVRVKKADISKMKNLIWVLVIPLGLVCYMVYLARTTGDALMFIHSQPAFGAERTGGEIILLPQVFWRYAKIIFTSSFTWQYFISCFELFVSLGFLALIAYSFFKMRLSYFVFSFLVFIAPTLTGTFSSMPRYVLAIFPCFIVLALVKNRLFKPFLVFISFILFLVLTVFFTSGFFVS